MSKYRKRPVIVDAEQFTHPATAPRGVFVGENGECWVVTIHGQKTPVVPGDWIIAEPDGEHFYPCKPDIFAATYEPADPPPATPPGMGGDRPPAAPQGPREGQATGWFLSRHDTGELIAQSIDRLLDRVKQAHHIDVSLRLNGRDVLLQADWIKLLRPVPPPPAPGGGAHCDECAAQADFGKIPVAKDLPPPPEITPELVEQARERGQRWREGMSRKAAVMEGRAAPRRLTPAPRPVADRGEGPTFGETIDKLRELRAEAEEVVERKLAGARTAPMVPLADLVGALGAPPETTAAEVLARISRWRDREIVLEAERRATLREVAGVLGPLADRLESLSHRIRSDYEDICHSPDFGSDRWEALVYIAGELRGLSVDANEEK